MPETLGPSSHLARRDLNAPGSVGRCEGRTAEGLAKCPATMKIGPERRVASSTARPPLWPAAVRASCSTSGATRGPESVTGPQPHCV